MSENQIRKQSIGDAVSESYAAYASEVNRGRMIIDALSGAKPVHRHILQAAYEICRNSKIKTATLVGHTMGHYHAHGDSSISSSVPGLVDAGFITGVGAWNKYSLRDGISPCAADRYTECYLDPVWAKIFGLVWDYVPEFKNTLGFYEKVFIPTPVPIQLVMGDINSSMGVGTASCNQSFTAKSMIEAYIANDPKLLKSQYGYRISPKWSNLKDIWKYGYGDIWYKYEDVKWDPNKREITITSSAKECSPDLSEFYELQDNGLCDILEMTGKGLPKGKSRMVLRKLTRRGQYISDEDFLKKWKDVEWFNIHSNLHVVDPHGKVVRCGVGSLIAICYKNYQHLVELYKADNIEKREYKICVEEWFNFVADLIRKEFTNEQILEEAAKLEKKPSKVELTHEIINSVGSRPINSFRTHDSEKNIKKFKAEIKEFKALKSEDVIMNFAEELDSMLVTLKDNK